MKPLTLFLSIAISAVTVSSDVTPAFATKMNGKCCQTSDGGRSVRYRRSLARRLIPQTCSGYAAACMRTTRSEPDSATACLAARSACMQTGVHVGPYSGMHFAGLERR